MPNFLTFSVSIWAALTPYPATLWWCRRNAVTRHQPSGRPQLRRLTHDDENIVGGEAEMGPRRRDLVRASSDRENQCTGLGTQTGGSQRLPDERRVRGDPQALHRHLWDTGDIAQAQASGSVAA